MIIVLDTYVVLQALNQRHPIDILMEYQEVIVRQSGPARWQTLGRLLDLAVAHGHNTQRVSPTFFFRTISADRDDDKFADCAIAANADFIITRDKHFNVLAGSGYRPQPISPRSLSVSISQPREAMLQP